MKNTSQSPENSYLNPTSSTAKTLVAVAAGVAAGAVTALLLAPKTGAETRKTLSLKANKIKDDVGQNIKQRFDNMGKKVSEANTDNI